MSIVVSFEVTGMSAQKYEQIMQQLEAAGQGAPDGRRFHVCFGDPERLQVIDVYDSPAQLEAFGGKLMPILERLGVRAIPRVLGEAKGIVAGT